MKSIPNKIIPFLISVLGILVGYIVANPLIFDICKKAYEFGSDIVCLDKTIKLVGLPLISFFTLAVPVTFLFLFTKKGVFRTWVKFAVWWIPFSLLCAYISPTTEHQTFKVIELSHDGTAQFFGVLFVIISLGIFVFKSWSLRKKDK